MKKFLPTLIFFFIAALFAAGTFFVNSAAAVGPCRSDLRGHCIQLAQTVIPGLEFLKLPTAATLGDLLLSLYYFAFSMIGVAALVGIIYGGILYMTAGDNTGRATEGRKWLGNAVTGLAVALVSWIILYTINPDLVTKLNFNLEPIRGVIDAPKGPVHTECNTSGVCVPVDGEGTSDCTACTKKDEVCGGSKSGDGYCKRPEKQCIFMSQSLCKRLGGTFGSCESFCSTP